MKQLLKLIVRELRIFYQSPKDYLYSFTELKNPKINVRAYNPNTASKAKRVIADIHKLFPNLHTHLVGSTGLHSIGRGDIDLFLESEPYKFRTYLPGLISLFGKPTKIRSRFIEWNSYLYNRRVEVILIDPSTKIFQNQIMQFKILKNNKQLLREYETLKKSSKDISVWEYTRRRMDFFNKMVRSEHTYNI